MQFQFMHLPLHSNSNGMVGAPLCPQSMFVISFDARNLHRREFPKNLRPSKIMENHRIGDSNPSNIVLDMPNPPIRTNAAPQKRTCKAWDHIQFRFVHLLLHSNLNGIVVPIFPQSLCIICFDARNLRRRESCSEEHPAPVQTISDRNVFLSQATFSPPISSISHLRISHDATRLRDIMDGVSAKSG